MKRKHLILATLIGGIIGAVIGIIYTGKNLKKQCAQLRALSDKHLELFLMMDQWVKIRQDGKNIAQYLTENGYKKIAIYGMSYVGQTLLSELQNTEVQVIYGIDQKADSICEKVNIVSKEAVMEQVDAVVVTAITFYDTIKKELENKLHCPILSIEDIIYEI